MKSPATVSFVTALRIFALLPVLFSLSLATMAGAIASSTTPPQCPVGQVPNWDNSACISVGQPYTLSGYGAPTQQKAVPQGGLNGAPAMHDCNGTPVPLSVACSAASPSMITQSISTIVATNNAAVASASAAAAAAAAAAAQPSIMIVAAGPAGSGTVSPTLSTGTDSTALLVNLLGDWYSGWLQYIAAAFNFDVANLQVISTTFLRLPPCFLGQATACQSAVWQQIGAWVGDVTGGS